MKASVMGGVVAYGAGRNDLIAKDATTLAWTLNESNANAKTLDVAIPEYGESFLVSLQNMSSVAKVDVTLFNMIDFDTAAVTCKVTALTQLGVAGVADGSDKASFVVQGWPMGTAGRISAKKDTTTCAAFAVKVSVRRIA